MIHTFMLAQIITRPDTPETLAARAHCLFWMLQPVNFIQKTYPHWFLFCVFARTWTHSHTCVRFQDFKACEGLLQTHCTGPLDTSCPIQWLTAGLFIRPRGIMLIRRLRHHLWVNKHPEWHGLLSMCLCVRGWINKYSQRYNEAVVQKLHLRAFRPAV